MFDEFAGRRLPRVTAAARVLSDVLVILLLLLWAISVEHPTIVSTTRYIGS